MSELSARAFRVTRLSGVRCLVPSDPFAEEFMAKLKDEREVLLSARRPRSVQQHKFLFALLRKITENTDRWADEETLLDDLKLATGLFETRISAITGLPYPVPASISFAAMDGDRFDKWFRKAIDVLAREVLHVLPEALRAEIEDMLGDRRKGGAI